MAQEKFITGKDILYLLIALLKMEPDISEWETKEFIENPPRQIRYQMLQSAAPSFGYNNPMDLAKGSFIGSQLKLYPAVLPSTITIQTKKVLPGNYTFLYKDLLKYRIILLAAQDFSRRYLAVGSFETILLAETIDDCNECLQGESFDKLDELLTLLIDPLQQKVLLNDLVQNGYPDVDIHDIDNEWM